MPPPSQTLATTNLSISMNLLILDILYKRNPTICGTFVSGFFHSDIMSSFFIHVVGWIEYLIPFLWPNNISWSEYTTFCLSIHLLMDIWVLLNFLAIMNNAAVNIRVWDFVCLHFLLTGPSCSVNPTTVSWSPSHEPDAGGSPDPGPPAFSAPALFLSWHHSSQTLLSKGEGLCVLFMAVSSELRTAAHSRWSINVCSIDKQKNNWHVLLPKPSHLIQDQFYQRFILSIFRLCVLLPWAPEPP